MWNIHKLGKVRRKNSACSINILEFYLLYWEFIWINRIYSLYIKSVLIIITKSNILLFDFRFLYWNMTEKLNKRNLVWKTSKLRLSLLLGKYWIKNFFSNLKPLYLAIFMWDKKKLTNCLFFCTWWNYELFVV